MEAAAKIASDTPGVSLPLRDAEPRSVTILGSTGSIGSNTIDLLQRHRDSFTVEALTAHSNIELLAEQARQTGAKLAVTADSSRYQDLKGALSGTNISVAAGPEAVEEAADAPADFVMAGIVGAAGLGPTLAAVRRGAIVGLANKECLVCAGALMLNEVARAGATLLPVDSEHNAIFQVFDFERDASVSRIILTASGGPFRSAELEHMVQATPAQAVAHPNWDMGAKISVDSATMMNKGLEMIEAFHLFPVTAEQIDVLVHPQSVIHSMVEYIDGSVLAQLGTPDMRTPIAYSLAWPERISAPSAKLDLAELATLTFEKPDLERFPCLRLAQEALNEGAAAAIVLNAANEVAVRSFLDENIGFMDIPRVVESCLERHDEDAVTSIDAVKEIDARTRAAAAEEIDRI
ncbi:MAG: 1-deoxy-D-xylulose 5-phosphate reductoisomerase [Alphaproteobacteria bacterium MarineAlpha10_Bin2]|nr:MAG: 1-deoxy-D-xylulose 5-phosphate reductoisomerase [Alphaproteobacteria bacterium MarineAlpha10_Bin2]